MSKRAWVFGGVLLVALAGGAVATKNYWAPGGAGAQAPRAQAGPRGVPVEVAKAVRQPVPVRIDALGNVTPMASVAIKARLETTIVDVHFADGAAVREGDVLFTLDCRQIEAQIRQSEAVIAGAKAQFEQAQRDLERQTELMAKSATTQVALQNAKTQVNIWRATAESNAANLDNLNVQRSYCTIRAPISGQISAAAVKVGNFVRPGDTAALATINQIVPIYVSFAVPQRYLSDIRDALAESDAKVEATLPGDTVRRATGRVSMIENAVDTATGMVMLRATMENKNEILWPGTLVNARLTLRTENAVTVPSTAVQVGQSGAFVFVIKDGTAAVRPVTTGRTVEQLTVIEKGLENGETVVTDGHLLLTNGSKVVVREAKSGS
jgi:multidrug efflux system membrane fusion protein